MQQPKATRISQASMRQVAMIVRDLEKTVQDYASLLSLGPFQIVEFERMRIKVAFARLGPVQLELIQPVGQDNAMWKLLGNKDVCLHHFGFDVTDMDAELGRFQELGVRVIQSGHSADKDFAILDTEQLTGVNFEFGQRRDGDQSDDQKG